MLRFVALSFILTIVPVVYGYGNNYDASRGFGGFSNNNCLTIGRLANGPLSGNYGGLANSALSGGYGGSSVYKGGSVGLAVQSSRSVNFVDVASSGASAEPLNVDVYSQLSPINFNFRSRSSDIKVNNIHEGSQGSYQETSSQDEPHVSVHTVTRPVVQQLREIITPYRQVTQEIQPVQEKINTLISRGQNAGASYDAGTGYGSGSSYGSGSGYGNFGNSGSQGYSKGYGSSGSLNYGNNY